MLFNWCDYCNVPTFHATPNTSLCEPFPLIGFKQLRWLASILFTNLGVVLSPDCILIAPSGWEYYACRKVRMPCPRRLDSFTQSHLRITLCYRWVRSSHSDFWWQIYSCRRQRENLENRKMKKLHWRKNKFKRTYHMSAENL